MKRLYVFAGILLILSLVFSGVAFSEDVVSIKGKVKTIDLKTNTVVIITQDQEVTVTVEDETTLAKFKDGRIREGDEVKVKYTTKDGKT